MNEAAKGGCVVVGGALAVMTLIGGGCWAVPNYRVWQQGMEGAARLREAESSRQILVEEAKAKYESAKLLATAEIERAKGVAESNRIIGEGLRDNEAYLFYLWIQVLGDHDNATIYIPTEANMPLLEAGRFLNPIKPKEDKK